MAIRHRFKQCWHHWKLLQLESGWQTSVWKFDKLNGVMLLKKRLQSALRFTVAVHYRNRRPFSLRTTQTVMRG